MIQEKPAWTYQTDKGLNQWYGNVATYEGRVLGQWFCLDAKTGDVLWEKDMEDPNTITGVSKGIIVATTTQSGGPWTASSGIYGLSLETGDLVWQAKPIKPSKGLFARLSYKLGLVRFTDSPNYVSENQVICTSEAILNIENGNVMHDAQAEPELSVEDSRANSLYGGAMINVDDQLQKNITRVKPGERVHMSTEKVVIYGYSGDDELNWEFNLHSLGYSAFFNYFSYRFHEPYIYFLGKEGDYYMPEVEGEALERRPAPFHLIAVDARSGEVVQDLRLPDEAHEYRIESSNSQGILLSHSNTQLALYPFADTISPSP
jgi:hypothetical protein